MAPKSLKTDVETKKKRTLKQKGGKTYALRIETDDKKNLGFGHLASPEEKQSWSENERKKNGYRYVNKFKGEYAI